MRTQHQVGKWIVTLLVLAILVTVTACNQASQTAAPSPTKAAAPTVQQAPAQPAPATQAPAAAATVAPAPPTAATARVPKGTLKIGVDSFGKERYGPKFGGGEMGPIIAVFDHPFYDNGKGSFDPGVFESWTTSPDGTTFTAKVRKGIKFHKNYGELTADDVVFTQKMALEKDSANATLTGFAANLVSLENPDQYTIVYKFKQQVPISFIMQMSDEIGESAIFSKKYIQEVGAQKAEAMPVGSGPYEMIEHKPGEYVVLKAVTNHWRSVPYYDQVKVSHIPEMSTRLAMMKTGELDISSLSLSLKAEAEKAGLKIVQGIGGSYTMIALGGNVLPSRKGYSPNSPWVGPDPAKALKVRQAMNLAINRKEVVDAIFGGLGGVNARHGIIPDSPYWNASWQPWQYDPDQAKKLLAEAGFPKGFDITLASFAMVGRNEMIDLTKAVAMYWSQIGINPKIEPVDYGVFKTKPQQRDTAGIAWPYMISESGSYDPTISMYKLDPTSTPPGLAGYESLEMDKMITTALNERDPEKRKKLIQDRSDYYHVNALEVEIGVKKPAYVIGPNVGEMPPPITSYNLGYQFIKPK